MHKSIIALILLDLFYKYKIDVFRYIIIIIIFRCQVVFVQSFTRDICNYSKSNYYALYLIIFFLFK